MERPESTTGPESAADTPEAVFAEFLGGDPSEETFRFLCWRHPEHQDALIQLWSDHRRRSRDYLPGFLEQLRQRGGWPDNLRRAGEFNRGGMGQIELVWDRDLRRHLAVKFILAKHRGSRWEDHVRRFLEEAQVTSQLDHPGIVPVHGLGIDDVDGPFFTMGLIENGEDLGEVFAAVKRGDAEWTQARVLGVVLKLCEAIAYAHSKGVVHRDIKPGNVMVGRFGETYLLDWGMAHVLGEPAHELESETAESPRVRTERSESPPSFLTQSTVGTPGYMAPEQVSSDFGSIGRATDVYAVGALLYHLLVGHAPYMIPGREAHWREVATRPPEGVLELAPGASRDLVAICERAMARQPGDRYPDTLKMARDIEAFLSKEPIENASVWRVVWLSMVRHRNLVLTGLASLLVVLTAVVWALGVREEEAARDRARSDAFSMKLLRQAVEDGGLHPLWPGGAERAREWQGTADRYLATYDEARIAAYSEDLPGLRDAVRGLRSVRFDVDEFARAATVAESWGELDRDAWAAAIAQVEADERYRVGGQPLRLRPIQGLQPIGPDPVTGYHEFLLRGSGALPERDRSRPGRHRLDRSSGIVLVLLPGGAFTMGADADEPGSAGEVEAEHRVVLSPFLLGKYEVTQAQWERLMGANPSYHSPEDPVYDVDWTHPVELVDWHGAMEFCRRLAVSLPSEAQWEFACRAGSRGSYYWGEDERGVVMRTASGGRRYRESTLDLTPEQASEDGYPVHTPVGRFEPNAFGLFDMQGNVSEWCADAFVSVIDSSSHRPGDGLVEGEGRIRSIRGASWGTQGQTKRSAFRQRGISHTETLLVGLRVALTVR